MLKVRIFSFSYRGSGIPPDTSGNGGGFVFDCRFINNPGRHAEFILLTGKDPEVITFLDSDEIMQKFLRNVEQIADFAVDHYIGREYTDLMISFGCTGGQHRSVYSAEKLKSHLEKKYEDKVELEIIHKDFPKI